MKSIIIIPARMASTRFPGKPLIKIDGIPMIQRVWQQAIKSEVGEVFVACCEKEVQDLIKNLGGKAILTDPNLPTGTDRIYSAFETINKSSDIECIINLQGDMPLINSEHIKKVREWGADGVIIGSAFVKRICESEKHLIVENIGEFCEEMRKAADENFAN